MIFVIWMVIRQGEASWRDRLTFWMECGTGIGLVVLGLVGMRRAAPKWGGCANDVCCGKKGGRGGAWVWAGRCAQYTGLYVGWMWGPVPIHECEIGALAGGVVWVWVLQETQV